MDSTAGSGSCRGQGSRDGQEHEQEQHRNPDQTSAVEPVTTREIRDAEREGEGESTQCKAIFKWLWCPAGVNNMDIASNGGGKANSCPTGSVHAPSSNSANSM